MPSSIERATPNTDANTEVIPFALQKNGSSSVVRRPMTKPKGNIIPMKNAGGARSSTDIRIRISVPAERAQLVASGVNSPVAMSATSSPQNRQMISRDDRGSRPTVVLPNPLNKSSVKST